jgi:hypothetical protein
MGVLLLCVVLAFSAFEEGAQAAMLRHFALVPFIVFSVGGLVRTVWIAVDYRNQGRE